MLKEYCVYKHMNKDNECIYVGLTDNMDRRQSEHKRSSKHYNDINTILYAQCENKTAMIVYEQYYINKLNPINNKADKREDRVQGLAGIRELSFNVYTFPEKVVQKEVSKKVLSTIKRYKEVHAYIMKYSLKKIEQESITLFNVPNKELQGLARSVRLRLLFFKNITTHKDKTNTVTFCNVHFIRGLCHWADVSEKITRSI